MSSISSQAYFKVGQFEILLRRIIRWQMMSMYSHEWISKLGDDFYKLIETRIQQEKNNGQYSKISSD